ncbi:MAG: alanine racemase [Bacilli bacterium]|nr:alanine racemase [Bacilli bacterium]
MIEIYLQHLKENLEYFRTSGKKIIGVVKNNAYGHGSVAISQALITYGVDYLFVNEIEEAVPLVEAGIQIPIMIHNSVDSNDYHLLKKYPNLVVTLNSYQDYLRLLGDPKLDHIRVQIQIDTKMSRLGIKDWVEFTQLMDMLRVHPKFHIDGIYTHFISVEAMAEQVSIFQKYAAFYPFPMIHCAASSTAFICSYGNYARIGLGLYDTKPLMRVAVKPLKIQVLEAGESIGYSAKYVAKTKEYIAVLPIGYGDGYSRRFEGFHVWCEDYTYEIVGRICMNHTFVKVNKNITTDHVFELLSTHLPAKELANYAGFINYEAYTNWQYRKVRYLP